MHHPATRVLIAEDHELFRRGLTELLEAEGFQVVGTAARAEEAIALARACSPDVVLLDLQLGESGGPDTIRRVVEAAPTARVVVLTASNAREDVLGALRAGATGYLTKEGTPDGLIRALRGVRRGEAPINRTLAAYLVEEVRLETRRRELLAKVPDREHLTPRQLEVLRLLAAGSSTERIASELYLSVETVRWHVKSILRKLRVSSRAEAIACLEELRAS